jgi:hypothetical protein
MSARQGTISTGNEKKDVRKTVRVEEGLFQIALQRISTMEANDFSDYVRGLIIADALSASAPMSGINIPGWLVGTRVSFALIENVDPPNPHEKTSPHLNLVLGTPEKPQFPPGVVGPNGMQAPTIKEKPNRIPSKQAPRKWQRR